MRRLAALLLALFLLPAFAAAEGASLPLNHLEGGRPYREEGWVFGYKKPESYEDSTISVTFAKKVFYHRLTAGKRKGLNARDEAWIVRVRVADPTQVRTAVSHDTYETSGYKMEDAAVMANRKNAVLAVNGDFFKYENYAGYVIRQGELIWDRTDNSRNRVFDMLLIDSAGDFHAVYSATTDKIDAYVAENLTPRGRTVINTFNIGPVLVVNGEAQDVSASEAARQGLYQWKTPMQRIAIVQTGELEYAVVQCGITPDSTGFTMQEFADFVAAECPDAILAYNLDGGGSLSLIARKSAANKKSEMICLYSGHRDITDILYFASAEE